MSIITLEDAKAHLNITGPEDDYVISAKIAAAEAWTGAYIGAALDDVAVFPEGPPEPVKEAVRQLVAHLYENREATVLGANAFVPPFGLTDLLGPYREIVL